MTDEERRKSNEELLSALNCNNRKYYICELRHRLNEGISKPIDSANVFALVSNIGLLLPPNLTFYDYESFVIEAYLIIKLWVTTDISIIRELKMLRTSREISEFIKNKNLELVYWEEEPKKEDKENISNIIDKYGLT